MNLSYFKRNILLINEGIQIKDFIKLNNDPEFIEACKLYASTIKNDNDAKQIFDLYDLDRYKQDFQTFIDRVQEAYQYIQEERQFKKLLKKPLPNGVNLVYKNKDVLIVSPETYKCSHEAAYLDGAQASWCVASPGEQAQYFWNRYKAEVIFYIYVPNQSYAMVIDENDVESMEKRNFKGNLEFSQLENRENKSFGKKDIIDENYTDILSYIEDTLSQEQFETILKKYINDRIDSLLIVKKLKNKLFQEQNLNALDELIKINPSYIIVSDEFDGTDCDILVDLYKFLKEETRFYTGYIDQPAINFVINIFKHILKNFSNEELKNLFFDGIIYYQIFTIFFPDVSEFPAFSINEIIALRELLDLIKSSNINNKEKLIGEYIDTLRKAIATKEFKHKINEDDSKFVKVELKNILNEFKKEVSDNFLMNKIETHLRWCNSSEEAESFLKNNISFYGKKKIKKVLIKMINDKDILKKFKKLKRFKNPNDNILYKKELSKIISNIIEQKVNL